MRVVNFGSLNIDYVYRVDHFVQPGETMSAQSLQIQCGGKGLNQSVALARAGVETWHAGLIGPEGHFLKETLDRAGVHTRFVEESAGSTGHAIIQVDSTGQNSILLHDGANGRLTPDFVTAVLDQFSAGDTVLLQNETSCVEEIIHQAARRGMRTAMNAAPANEKLVGLPLEALSWLLVNEVEGAFLAGTEAPEAILDTLAARYPETTVVLTLGEQGAAAARGGWRAWGPARKTAVVDTTAAGDTFTGYFLRRALEGGTLEEALSLAAAASALAVSRPGAAMRCRDAKSCRTPNRKNTGSPGRNSVQGFVLSCGPIDPQSRFRTAAEPRASSVRYLATVRRAMRMPCPPAPASRVTERAAVVLLPDQLQQPQLHRLLGGTLLPQSAAEEIAEGVRPLPALEVFLPSGPGDGGGMEVESLRQCHHGHGDQLCGLAGKKARWVSRIASAHWRRVLPRRSRLFSSHLALLHLC